MEQKGRRRKETAKGGSRGIVNLKVKSLTPPSVRIEKRRNSTYYVSGSDANGRDKGGIGGRKPAVSRSRCKSRKARESTFEENLLSRATSKIISLNSPPAGSR